MVEKDAHKDGKIFGGGGLVGSAGGLDKLKALQESGDKWLSDERIFGSGAFVERLLGEAEARSELAPVESDDQKWERFYQVQDRLCQQCSVTSAEVCGAGRKRIVSEVRRLLFYCGQRQLGLSAARITRYLGVSGQSVLQGAAKAEEEWDDLSWLLDDL